MSSSPGARSKTRSTSKNETERAARYEKRSSPQSATADTTAAATIAATPTPEQSATADATAAATIAATSTTTTTPEARCPELQQCQNSRCRRMDANYDICYYDELGEQTTQEICWRCRNNLKRSHKYRGGTIVSIIKTSEVESEYSESDDEETRELLQPTTQRQSYDCQDIACMSGKPVQYIVSLKNPSEFLVKTKSICEDCLPTYSGKTHFGEEQIISVEKRIFDFSPKTSLPDTVQAIAATDDATAKATDTMLQVTQILNKEIEVTQKSEKEASVTQAQKSNTESRDTEMSDASPLPPTPKTPNLTITANRDPRNFNINWNNINQKELDRWVNDGCRKQDIPQDLNIRIFDQYGFHLHEHPDYDSIVTAWKGKSLSLCTRRDVFDSAECKAWINAGFPAKQTPQHVLSIWKTLLGDRYPHISSGQLYVRDLLVLYNEYREFFPRKQIDAACNSLNPPTATPSQSTTQTSPQPATQGQTSTDTNNTKGSTSPMTVSFAEAAEKANNQMERQARGSPSPIPGAEGIIPPLQRT